MDTTTSHGGGGLGIRVARCLIASICVVMSSACAEPVVHPDIVLVSLDTLRADHVGAYGYERQVTTTLDGLASRGVTFLNAYSQAPNTSPSHTSILTSLYPSVHSVWDHGQGLDPTVPTLAGTLSDAGYATAGFTQLNGPSYAHGFETWEFLDSPFDKGKGLGDISPILAWLDARGADEPFFLFLHSYDVHLPYNPEPEYLERVSPDYHGQLPSAVFRGLIDRINSGEIELTDEDREYLTALYDAELLRADEILGTIFDHIRAIGRGDRTVFVVLGDHGEEFGEHGLVGRHTYSLYDELLRIPLIMAGPGVPKGRRIGATVRAVDVAPTLVHLAGVEVPETFMGDDLSPLWTGEEDGNRLVVSEKKSERILVRWPYKYFSDGRLFDLSQDPREQTDIAGDSPAIVREMTRRMDRIASRFARRRAQVNTDETIDLTPEEIERLRALGYLE